MIEIADASGHVRQSTIRGCPYLASSKIKARTSMYEEFNVCRV